MAAATPDFAAVFLQENLRQHLAQFVVMADALTLRCLDTAFAQASREHIFWTRDVVIMPSIRVRELHRFHRKVHTALLTSQGKNRLCAVARHLGPALRHLKVRTSADDPDPALFYALVIRHVLPAAPRLQRLAFGCGHAIGPESSPDFAVLSKLPCLTAIRMAVRDVAMFAALWRAVTRASLRLRHVHVFYNTTATRRFHIGGGTQNPHRGWGRTCTFCDTLRRTSRVGRWTCPRGATLASCSASAWRGAGSCRASGDPRRQFFGQLVALPDDQNR